VLPFPACFAENRRNLKEEKRAAMPSLSQRARVRREIAKCAAAAAAAAAAASGVENAAQLPPHCKICGDLEPLLAISGSATDDGVACHLCVDCYRIQRMMA
jgi:hypothetical protein